MSVKDWNVTITQGITEGLEHQQWVFTPEIEALFINKSQASCLAPKLEFYPTALKDSVHSGLIKRMMLRSSIYPPSPDIFYSKNYLIFAWEIEDYDNKICCNCENLRYTLIRDLKLRSHFSNRIITRVFDAENLHYSDEEIRSIIEQMLNIPGLDQYFHVEEESNRVPLVLEQTSKVRASSLKGLKKFDQEILILDRNEIDKQKFKNYLLIDKWFMQDGLLNIQLHYPIEGVFAIITFEKVNSEWQIRNQKISEY